MRWRDKDKKETELVDPMVNVRLVRDMTRVWGMRPVKVEGVGLVTGLDNTGSDPAASPLRDLLIDDMQRRGVESPSKVLQLPSTSLVTVKANLPPGVQKGDRVDLEVLTPAMSQTVSLRDGWLMQSRLQEMAVLGNRLRSGRLMATGEGELLVQTLLEGDGKERSETRGRILGGAVSTVSRGLGLVLVSEHHSVRASAMIGTAINTRFHHYDRGTKRGVANPKRDNFIELAVHSRYRHNLVRYARVVQAVPVRETPHEQMERMAELEAQLMDPKSATVAAVDLEAIGPEALPTLRKGLAAESSLVRFAAAEALAYMNEVDAVPHLVEAAEHESAFRWHALASLSAMTESDAREGLAQLLHAESDETRYGAFRALGHFNPRDPAVQGESLGDVMKLHVVPTDTSPLVHVRRSERPEVVLFGKQIALQPPVAVFAGKHFLIKSEDGDRLKVTYFTLGQEDRSASCSNDLGHIIRTLIQMGGSYADVVSAINDAKQKGLLAARVKFDALPQPGRHYDLEEERQADPDAINPEELEAGMEIDGLDDESPATPSRDKKESGGKDGDDKDSSEKSPSESPDVAEAKTSSPSLGG